MHRRSPRASARLACSWLLSVPLCAAAGLPAAASERAVEIERLPAHAHAPLNLDSLVPARRTGRVVVELPGGKSLRLIPRPRALEIDGTTTLAASDGEHRLLATLDGSRVYGHVVSGSSLYVIDTVDGKPLVLDADRLGGPQPGPGGWRNDAVVDAQRTQSLVMRGKLLQALDGPATVDVAIFVEPRLDTEYGTQAVRTRAQASIEFTNEAFRRNSLPISLRLVYVGPFAEALPLDAAADLFGIFSRSNAAAQLAQKHGADLRHLLYSQDARPGLGFCGMGNLVGDVGISGYECGQHIFAHELGHNFGAHHDRANVPPAQIGAGAHNFGYTCGGRGTLMSYAGAGRVDHYSAPELAFGGEACGVPAGLPDAAHNAATIDAHRAAVSQFRAPPVILGSVRLAESRLALEERGAPASIAIVRDGDLSLEGSVEVALLDGTATEGEDVRPLLQRVSFAPGESLRTVEIAPIDDDAYDAPVETLRALLRYPWRLSVAGEPLEISIGGSDDGDRGRATFNATGGSTRESVGTVRVGVSRTGPSAEALSVSFEAMNETALNGVDYRLAPGTLTFAPGETQREIVIEILDDALFQGYEAYRYFTVRLTGANLGTTREFRLFVFNDDWQRGRVQFEDAGVVAPRGSTNALLTVKRVEGTEGDLRFSYATLDGSGQAGVHYVARSGEITMANGTSTVTLDVPLLDTASVRTFTVALSGDAVGAPAKSTVTIGGNVAASEAPEEDRGGGGLIQWALLVMLASALVVRGR